MPEPLYTIRTLHSIKETEPDTNLILLIGGDNIESIRRWYRGSEILAEFEVWVYPRHGYDGENACREISAMPGVRGIRYLADAPILNISSTSIRTHAPQGNHPITQLNSDRNS